MEPGWATRIPELPQPWTTSVGKFWLHSPAGWPGCEHANEVLSAFYCQSHCEGEPRYSLYAKPRIFGCLVQALEPVRVQALGAELTVEAFDERIVGQFARS